MYIEKFDKSHIKQLVKLSEKRDIKEDLNQLPELGYIAFEDIMDTPIAAGFLRRCEGGIAILDSYITNPVMPASYRHEALELITKKLIRDAKALELKGLILFTADNSIIKRSLRHNFRKLHQTIMTLKIPPSSQE